MKINTEEKNPNQNKNLPELAYLTYLQTLNKLVAVVLIVLIVGHTEVPIRTWQAVTFLLRMF